jgi:penicillin-binding protein 2
VSVLVEHGGFGGDAATPKAAQLLRIALLKDPEIRARIITPAPSQALAPGIHAPGDHAISEPAA